MRRGKVTTPVGEEVRMKEEEEEGSGRGWEAGLEGGGQLTKNAAALQLNQIGADIQLTAAVRNITWLSLSSLRLTFHTFHRVECFCGHDNTKIFTHKLQF